MSFVKTSLARPGGAILVITLLLGACGSTDSTTTPGPSPTNAVVPSPVPTKAAPATPRPTRTPVALPTLLPVPDASVGLKIAPPYVFPGHLVEVTAAGVEEAVLAALPSDHDGFEFGALAVKDVDHFDRYAAFVAVIRLPAMELSSEESLDGLAARIADAGQGTWRLETVGDADVRIISGPAGNSEIVFVVGDRLVWCFAAPEASLLGVATAILQANP